MLKSGKLTGLALLLSGVLLWVGCSPAEPTATGAAASGEGEASLAEAMPSELGEAAPAGLSAEDQALADAQKVCPVGGAELGSMGTPVKVEHDGKAYFLCCEHCREPFLKEPEKHIATLTAPKAE